MNISLTQDIEYALFEANIMERALDSYDQNRMLRTAMSLSGAPYSFIEEIFQKKCKSLKDNEIFF